jgi:hypothetical protein
MTENQLRTSLRDWADETPAGEPPIDDLMARGTRRRRRRAAIRVSVAALAAVAAAAAAGIGVTASAGRDPATPAVSAAPDRPALTLAAAITSTTSTSFRYQADLVQPGTGTTRCTGVIDPATQSGYSKYGMTEHWVVNGVRYLKEGNHRYVIGTGDAAEFLTCGGTRAGHGLLSADPLTMLDNLKNVSSVRQDDATYAFSSPTLRGTVTLREGRVSSMTVHIDTPAQRRDVTMTLSDYGVRVAPKAPW